MLSRAIDEREALHLTEAYTHVFEATANSTMTGFTSGQASIDLSDALTALHRRPSEVIPVVSHALGGTASLCEASAVVVAPRGHRSTDLWQHVRAAHASTRELHVLVPLHDFGTLGRLAKTHSGVWEVANTPGATQSQEIGPVDVASSAHASTARFSARLGDAIFVLPGTPLRRTRNQSNNAAATVVLRFAASPSDCAAEKR